MPELKFENEANTSSDTALDLNAAEQHVGLAIEDSIEQAAEQQQQAPEGPAAHASGSKHQGSTFYDDMLSAKLGGGGRGMNFANIGMTIHSEMRGGHSRFFPGGATETSSKAEPAKHSRFMPSTYVERVRDARKPAHQAKDIMGRPIQKRPGGPAGLVERAGIAGRSLTGQTDCHAKACTIKGLKADPQAAVKLGLIPAYLLDMQLSIRRAKTGPMSQQRLLQGLQAGNQDAENEFEHSAPVQQAALTAQSSPTAPKPQSAGGKA